MEQREGEEIGHLTKEEDQEKQFHLFQRSGSTGISGYSIFYIETYTYYRKRKK